MSLRQARWGDPKAAGSAGLQSGGHVVFGVSHLGQGINSRNFQHVSGFQPLSMTTEPWVPAGRETKMRTVAFRGPRFGGDAKRGELPKVPEGKTARQETRTHPGVITSAQWGRGS